MRELKKNLYFNTVNKICKNETARFKETSFLKIGVFNEALRVTFGQIYID